MPTTQPAIPTISRPGHSPATSRKLFVNIAVDDLQRAIDFFEGLGFQFNPYFTDDTATCMLVGEDAYFMLLTRPKFVDFSRRPLGDPRRETNAMFAVAVESREAVDALVAKAVAHGGAEAGDPEDHGFMYSRSFYDLDGHHWGVFWMDPEVVAAAAEE